MRRRSFQRTRSLHWIIFHIPFSPYSLKIIIVTIIIQFFFKADIKNNAYAASLKAVTVRTSSSMSEEILGASKNVCVCIYGPMYICVYNPVLLYLMVSKYFKLVFTTPLWVRYCFIQFLQDQTEMQQSGEVTFKEITGCRAGSLEIPTALLLKAPF